MFYILWDCFYAQKVCGVASLLKSMGKGDGVSFENVFYGLREGMDGRLGFCCLVLKWLFGRLDIC